MRSKIKLLSFIGALLTFGLNVYFIFYAGSLNDGEEIVYQQFQRIRKGVKIPRDLNHQPCGPEKYATIPFPHLTGLASFPGSGNTLLRHLVQASTGVLTGSEYKDNDLLTHGFLAEGIHNHSTVLVKTHGSDQSTLSSYRKVVLLMRHPRDAILAEFNRVHAGRHGAANVKHFRKYWPKFCREHTEGWLDFYTRWLQYPRPMLVVLYEDIVKDMDGELQRLHDFLKIETDPSRVKCSISSSRFIKRRAKGFKAERVYKKKTLLLLEDVYGTVVEKFRCKLSGCSAQ